MVVDNKVMSCLKNKKKTPKNLSLPFGSHIVLTFSLMLLFFSGFSLNVNSESQQCQMNSSGIQEFIINSSRQCPFLRYFFTFYSLQYLSLEGNKKNTEIYLMLIWFIILISQELTF